MDVDPARLHAHILAIAQRPRPAGSPELEQARDYVNGQLREFGWLVRPHEFAATDDWGTRLQGINLIAEHPAHLLGNRPRFCIGAHLDSRPDSPGADDNASAVGALLEIARLLPQSWPADSTFDLELVFFDLEENGMLGGSEHAQLTKANNVDLRGMVSLEMLGYCDHARNSQKLPRTLAGLYPDTGNFIAVIGNQNSTDLIAAFAAGMRRTPGLPVETLQVPSNGDLLQATRLSDHSPFWDAGYPALMITDTSFMRNPHYHLASDTLETLDMGFLSLVSQGCCEAVRRMLANSDT